MEFLEPIALAVPHIYVSALPFAPQNSKISMHFLKLFQKTVIVKMGQMEHWSKKCFLILGDHDACVTSVAFSPDGRHIVSGSGDKTVRVWDAQTGQSVMDPLKGHDKRVTSVAFSPDGRHIVSGSGDNTVVVWDAQTGQSVMDPLKGHDNYVNSVAFSPDGRHIVSGSGDKTVRVWDAQTGQSVMDPLKGHDEEVSSVAFSPDGRHIVSGSCDKRVRVWDAQTGQSVMDPLEGHDKEVSSVAFSPDGRHIVSGSHDMTVRVWDAQSITDTLTVSCLSTCPATGNLVSLPITTVHSEDGKITMSDIHKTFLCDFYDIPLLQFCHYQQNWLMLSDNTYLLWVPDQIKSGLIWPRTTTVIGCTPTSLCLENFVHGVEWSQCFSS